MKKLRIRITSYDEKFLPDKIDSPIVVELYKVVREVLKKHKLKGYSLNMEIKGKENNET